MLLKKQTLIERMTGKATITESDRKKLAEGVLCHVIYPICKIGELNRNKRRYRNEVWEKVDQDPDIREKLRTRSLFGHAEHPKDTSQSNTEKISHVVTEIFKEGNIEKCGSDILDTPYGRIVDTLLRAECGIGMSTRAEGDLEECQEGEETFYDVVPESYSLKTVDFTADASTYGAYPESVERDVVGIIKTGIDNEKIDRQYATVMLESMHVSEAKDLLESIQHDKGHKACQCKKSEKKCMKGCAHANENKVREDIDAEVTAAGQAFKDYVLKVNKVAWHTLSDATLRQALDDFKKEGQVKEVGDSAHIGEPAVPSGTGAGGDKAKALRQDTPRIMGEGQGKYAKQIMQAYQSWEKDFPNVQADSDDIFNDVVRALEDSGYTMTPAEKQALMQEITGTDVNEARVQKAAGKKRKIKEMEAGAGGGPSGIPQGTTGAGAAQDKAKGDIGERGIGAGDRVEFTASAESYPLAAQQVGAKQGAKGTVKSSPKKLMIDKENYTYTVDVLMDGAKEPFEAEIQHLKIVKEAIAFHNPDKPRVAMKPGTKPVPCGNCGKPVDNNEYTLCPACRGEKAKESVREGLKFTWETWSAEELTEFKAIAEKNPVRFGRMFSPDRKTPLNTVERKLAEDTLAQAINKLKESTDKGGKAMGKGVIKEDNTGIDFETIYKEMQKASDDMFLPDKDKKVLSEAKTPMSLYKSMIKVLAEARKNEAISKAERDKAMEVAESIAAETQGKMTKITEQAKAQIKKFGEDLLKEIKGIYEKKIESVKKHYETMIAEQKAKHEADMFQRTVVEMRVRESGLQIPENTLVMLRQCKTAEEVDSMISKIRFALREGMMGGGAPGSIHIELPDGDKDPMITETERLVAGIR
jgi:hypothetical protein